MRRGWAPGGGGVLSRLVGGEGTRRASERSSAGRRARASWVEGGGGMIPVQHRQTGNAHAYERATTVPYICTYITVCSLTATARCEPHGFPHLFRDGIGNWLQSQPSIEMSALLCFPRRELLASTHTPSTSIGIRSVALHPHSPPPSPRPARRMQTRDELIAPSSVTPRLVERSNQRPCSPHQPGLFPASYIPRGCDWRRMFNAPDPNIITRQVLFTYWRSAGDKEPIVDVVFSQSPAGQWPGRGVAQRECEGATVIYRCCTYRYVTLAVEYGPRWYLQKKKKRPLTTCAVDTGSFLILHRHALLKAAARTISLASRNMSCFRFAMLQQRHPEAAWEHPDLHHDLHCTR